MTVQVINAHPSIRQPRAPIVRCVRGVLSKERRVRGDITVVLVDDRTSRRLNRRFLAHDRPTDVLAFPLGDGQNLEGEIYVNLDKARRQARTYRVTPANETARLVIHGVLHLVGYDDRTGLRARRMKRREDDLVRFLAGPR